VEQQKPPPPRLSEDSRARLVTVGGPINRVQVSLRVMGDTLDPAAASRLLGCLPTTARMKGDVVPDPRYHRVASTGLWMLEGSLPEESDLEDQVRALLSRATDDLEAWEQVGRDSAVDIYCGLFLDDINRGLDLSQELIQMLGVRGIGLGFDIYCPLGSG